MSISKEYNHDWGLLKGVLMATRKGVYEFIYMCFKCQEKRTIYKEFV